MANNNIDDKWLIVYQGTKANFESDANKNDYNNKLVIVTGGNDTNAEPYLYVNNGTNDITIPIPKMYLKGVKIGLNGTEQGFVDDFLAFVESNGISIDFKGNAVAIGIEKDTLDKIDSINNKFDKTDTIPAERVGGLSVGANGLASDNSIIANRIPYLKADAFAFLKPEDFTVEVAYDGLTWVPLDNNNADMRGMFAQWNFGTGFPIDGSNTNWKVGSKIRITLDPKADRNAKVDFVALNVYANGRTFDILTEYYDRSSGKEGWYSVGDQLSINSNGIGFVKYNQYFSFAGYARGGARFTFTITTNTQYGSKIVGISGFGNLAAEIFPTSTNAPYTLGTLWYWDYLKNIYFPNEIYEGGTSLKNKYASITSAIQEIESANDKYISISDVGNTLKPTKRIAIRTASIKDEVDGLVTAQDIRDSIKIPTELPNPEALEISLNGHPVETYNGSSTYKLNFYAPTKVGSKGQVFKSIDGVMVDWDNVDWSEIKNKPDVINFANDLTGVLVPSPEEFTYRPSARDTSIRDGGAIIRRIKGNTTVWGQYVKNGDFTEGTRYFSELNSTLSDNGDGSITVTNKLDNSCGLITGFDTHIPRGHKILAIVDYQRDSALSSSTFFYLHRNGGGFDTHITSGFADAQRRVDYAIITSTDDIVGFFFYPFFYGPVGTQSIIYTMAVYDLTAIFDAGNEPTTLEAFREVYPDGYYPYCEPTIRNVKTTAIETVGFNQWDEEWEVGRFDTVTGENRESSNHIRCKNLIKVLPNTVYALYVGDSRSGIYAMFYDNNENILTPIIYSDDSWTVDNLLRISSNIRYNAFITPEGTSWMKFYLETNYGSTYTNDVCISLFHTGIRRGEYEPYKEHILNLPEIAEYFHDGMNGIGKVYDEINAENAVKRFGVVDLGTLDWRIGGTANNVDKRIYSYGLIDVAKGVASHLVGNIMCNKYNAISADQNYLRNKGISLSQTSSGVMMHIYDPNYNSDDKLSDFVASLNGVLLYYELAEPIVTPILEPIQLVYDVEDFGTERAVSLLPSAPFRADTVYQFNAEGRIRDNGRNIERLENKIRSYHDDGAMVSIDREIITTKSIIGNSEFRYALPDAPQDVKGDADGTLATEFWVQKNIPTEIATATQKREFEYTAGITPFIPNIMYECNRAPADNELITIPLLAESQDGYDHVWMIRFPAIGVSNKLSYPFDIRWKDGTAPRFTTACTLELYFKKIGGNGIIGEWKIYR